MITKKYYIKFAKLFGTNDAFNETKQQLIEDIINLFAEDNERFDRDRFRAAIAKQTEALKQ